MPNRRMIDASIWLNEDLAVLTYRQRLLFIGLFSNADDQGRLRGHPALISSAVFPYEVIPTEEMRADIDAVDGTGSLVRYEVDGKEYIQLAYWWTHQQLQWAKPSEWPAPDGWQDRIRVRRGDGVLTHDWPGLDDHTPGKTLRQQTAKKTPVTDTCNNRRGDNDNPNGNPNEKDSSSSGARPDDDKPPDLHTTTLLISKAWSEARGGLTNPLDGQRLTEMEAEYGPQNVLDAIHGANNSRTQGKSINLNYVEAFLKRWQQEGRDTKFDPNKAITEREKAAKAENTKKALDDWAAESARKQARKEERDAAWAEKIAAPDYKPREKPAFLAISESDGDQVNPS